MSLSIAGLLLPIISVLVICVQRNHSEPSLVNLHEKNLARQKVIYDACQRSPPYYSLDDIPNKWLRNILIDHRHRLLYCYVPKVACTNWKRIMMILTAKWNTTDPESIPPNIPHRPRQFSHLGNYRKEARDIMLRKYQKMIVVRNPFERVLSAYRNKLVGNSDTAKEFQMRIGRHIIQTFRRNPSNNSLRYGHDVTFREFATFLTSNITRLSGIVNNEHWRPITNLCHPCHIGYTLVGKYETIMDDARLALHTINASHIQFPSPTHPLITARLLPSYFSQLDDSLIERLRLKYKQDFSIFNYNTDSIFYYNYTAVYRQTP